MWADLHKESDEVEIKEMAYPYMTQCKRRRATLVCAQTFVVMLLLLGIRVVSKSQSSVDFTLK